MVLFARQRHLSRWPECASLTRVAAPLRNTLRACCPTLHPAYVLDRDGDSCCHLVQSCFFTSIRVASFSLSSLRARISRVRTDPSGIPITSAISAEFNSRTVESSSGWRRSSGSVAIIFCNKLCISRLAKTSSGAAAVSRKSATVSTSNGAPDSLAASPSPITNSWPATDARRERRSSAVVRSEEHTSELQSRSDLVCRLLLE